MNKKIILTLGIIAIIVGMSSLPTVFSANTDADKKENNTGIILKEKHYDFAFIKSTKPVYVERHNVPTICWAYIKYDDLCFTLKDGDGLGSIHITEIGSGQADCYDDGESIFIDHIIGRIFAGGISGYFDIFGFARDITVSSY